MVSMISVLGNSTSYLKVPRVVGFLEVLNLPLYIRFWHEVGEKKWDTVNVCFSVNTHVNKMPFCEFVYAVSVGRIKVHRTIFMK